ncbi:Potassium channel protein [Tenacibaculum litopenaei]|jgi:voltage-gated potassium channel|uniref:ion transporter n=1 Tax=Tenacibaculum litopenaei TaxID=396016 RepID=UPI0038940792
MKVLKNKLALLVDDEQGTMRGTAFFEYFISALIVANMVAIVLESYEEIMPVYGDWLMNFELFSIGVFTVEYLIRIWVSDERHPELPAWKARWKYMTSFLGLVDLLAILPFYLPYLLLMDLRILRSLRLFRLIRLLKLNRYFTSLRLIRNVILKTKNEIAVTVFLVFILLVLASTLMYNIEKQAQPEAFKNIGESMWWAVATLTTVGYGDVYPITGLGKLLSAFIALLGIGIVALPTGIISSAYMEEFRELKGKTTSCSCPHCGKEL